MYLEMLYSRYGSAIEKQAMVKQALNPFQLAKLGKSFYSKGRGMRFEQLLAKRNNALNRSIVNTRDMKRSDLLDPARRERAYLGHNKGPLNKAMEAAGRRTIDFHTQPGPFRSPSGRSNYIRENISYFADPHYPYTAGIFSPADLDSVATFARTNSPSSWYL